MPILPAVACLRSEKGSDCNFVSERSKSPSRCFAWSLEFNSSLTRFRCTCIENLKFCSPHQYKIKVSLQPPPRVTLYLPSSTSPANFKLNFQYSDVDLFEPFFESSPYDWTLNDVGPTLAGRSSFASWFSIRICGPEMPDHGPLLSML